MATTSDTADEQKTAEISSANDELFPGVKDVATFSQQTLGRLMQATKAAHGLPAYGDDYDFYSSYDSFREYCHSQSERLLQNINGMLHLEGSKACLTGGSSAPELEDKTDAIIETNDVILEKVGLLLDEATGLIKPGKAVLPPGSQPKAPQKLMVASWNRQSSTDSGKGRAFHLMHAKNISRPQLKFKEKIDNSNTPFVPIITSKPNALKPLHKALSSPRKSKQGGRDVPDAVSSFIHQQRVGAEESSDITAHPYQYELDHFVPDPTMLLPVVAPSYKPLDTTPLTLVDTAEQLQELGQALDTLKEFAVDLEHHSYRSFQGFTCLMQISTGCHDYIIDTLALRSELRSLNNSFTNPAIVKVFHGADMDIEWLQRDLGLYVVNMFDTHQASRILGHARHSLAHLLQLYCGVEPDKAYQLADWRIRPLPQEMINYSRSDTHYLLYVYHCMKNELIERGNEANNLLQQTLQQSRQVCLRRYKKQIFTDDAHLALRRRNKKPMNPKQYEALKLLYAWRDQLARQEDESTGYILPNHMMFQIAENLPREAHGVLACCNPIPPLVRQQLNEVHQLILRARMYQGRTKKPSPSPSPKTFASPSSSPMETPTPGKLTPKTPSSLLYCPHDPTPQHVTPDQSHDPSVPVAHYSALFGDEERPRIVRTARSIITAFDSSSDEETDKTQPTPGQQKVARLKALFVNPFEMYLPPKHLVQIAPALLEADKINLTPAGSKKSTASSSSSTEVPLETTQSMWKLKKRPRPPPKPAQSDITTPGNANNNRETEGDTRGDTTEETAATEDETTLRQQKRKAASSLDEAAPMTYRPPAKREKKSDDRRPNPHTNRATDPGAFTPFDYSMVNTAATSDRGRGRGRGNQGRGWGNQGRGRGDRGRGVAKHFDPFSHTSTRGRPEFKNKGRPKMPRGSGQHSVTYTKHDGGRGARGRHHWPKR
ncbi:exosome component 10-like [Patiria miniata]|uniref:Exosome complex component 10 n=1 Tax=Patiria miniata TaxID=46514 RepID=A0A914BKH8_PATMI|nr:exosome component 10-like [Patiria miniata]